MVKFRRKSEAERRCEIRDAARRIFLSKGYRHVTMEDIISETSLSKGGVYQYYKNTKDILIDIMKVGNSFRFSKLKAIEEQLSTNLSIEEVLLELSLNKLFDANADKKIYVMFLSEVIYDKDFADLYYQIERESKKELTEILLKRFPDRTKQQVEKNYLLNSRLINALILGDQIFDDRAIFQENKAMISKMLRQLF